MLMPKFVIKWRRQRAVERMCDIGAHLRDLEAQRSELDTSFEHTQVDAAYLDSRIASLTRQRERFIELLKTTPAY